MSEIDQLKNELQQIQLAYALQRQISHFKGGFLARISHELRSPLSQLTSLHQLILNDLCENPQEEREFIKQAHGCANNLLHILDEMIIISKIDYGHIEPKLEVISSKQVILELVSITYRLAENKKISLNLSLPQEDLFLETDQQKSLQALLILLETLLEEITAGSLEIILSKDKTSKFASISFLCEQLEKFLFDPIDLLTSPDSPKVDKNGSFRLSPSTKFVMAQTLLESIKGSFGVLDGGLYCLLPLHLSS
jgi:signal transduction histidine kinase